MSLFNNLIVSSLPIIPKPIVGFVAGRYIAGAEFEDASRVTRNLNAQRIMATMDLLGEDVLDHSEAVTAKDAYKEILRSIDRAHLDSNLSLKLTQIGLKLDGSFCEQNLREILLVAREKKNFIRIDMEDHTCTDATLDLYNSVRGDFDNVGVAIQAYLRRSPADVLELVKKRSNFRLCKGIYVEPEAIAFKDREEIRRNFLTLLRIMIDGGAYVGVATHDDVLVDAACRIIAERRLSPDKYEFQMLLGVKEKLRLKLREKGHRVRVYVPFGKQWYPYSVRRLKENPAIAGYVLKTIFSKDSVN
ncbi:MAG: proline dehydrogenase family protein [Bacteroidota bacterium]